MANFVFNVPDPNLLFNLMIPILRDWVNNEILAGIKSDLSGGGRDTYYPKKASNILYESGNIRIEINMNEVATCIELGRRSGKMPTVSAIRSWIQVKHIIPRNKTTIDQLSFLIARSIGRKGTKGKHYLYDATNKAELPDLIGDAIDQYFESFSMLEKMS